MQKNKTKYAKEEASMNVGIVGIPEQFLPINNIPSNTNREKEINSSSFTFYIYKLHLLAIF